MDYAFIPDTETFSAASTYNFIFSSCILNTWQVLTKAPLFENISSEASHRTSENLTSDFCAFAVCPSTSVRVAQDFSSIPVLFQTVF